MKYFAHITADHWSAKNKLEKAVKEYIKTKDRTLLNDVKSVTSFLLSLESGIDNLNKEYSKCKPVNYGQWADDGMVHIYVVSVFQMQICPVQHEI
jgi:hypothetical protein